MVPQRPRKNVSPAPVQAATAMPIQPRPSEGGGSAGAPAAEPVPPVTPRPTDMLRRFRRGRWTLTPA